ncbi:MAG: 4Fe-4S dicluster domain-containing protein [Thermodesulfobacteriota bacterium]
MGHLAAKDVYHHLGRKVDGLHVRAPNNEVFYRILKELYSEEEAEVVVKMPFNLSNLERVARTVGMDRGRIKKILDGLCAKGLVMDVHARGEYRYMPNPLFVGIFEFTMMRTDGHPNMKDWALLFHEYMSEGAPYRANFDPTTQTSIARALPHEETLAEHVEVLDYERISAVLDETDQFAVGTCSCRHKKEHSGEERCEVPLGTCTTLGNGADYLVRNKLSQAISKSEMKEIFARSRELGLIFCADNVRRRITFVCHCCGCCCGILEGINVHGLTATLVTSTLIAQVDRDACDGCGRCERACHVQAVKMIPTDRPDSKTGRIAAIDQDFCLGCGVCALKCKNGVLKLVKRKKRVIHPETTFERVILQCLERGTLENQLFDNPNSRGQAAMRYLVGGFLRLTPVKKALMSDVLRSSFLKALSGGVKVLGRGYLTEL